MTKVMSPMPGAVHEPAGAEDHAQHNETYLVVNSQYESVSIGLYVRCQCAKLISAVTTDYLLPRMEFPKGVPLNCKIVKEFTYNCDSLRIRAAADGDGGVMVTVAGPCSLKSVMRLLADIEAEVIGPIRILLLDLSQAVLMFGLEAAVSLCDRCTGMPLLQLPIVVVAPWIDAETRSRYQVESAMRGVIRRVFSDVSSGCRWAQDYLQRQAC